MKKVAIVTKNQLFDWCFGQLAGQESIPTKQDFDALRVKLALNNWEKLKAFKDCKSCRAGRRISENEGINKLSRYLCIIFILTISVSCSDEQTNKADDVIIEHYETGSTKNEKRFFDRDTANPVSSVHADSIYIDTNDISGTGGRPYKELNK